MSSFLLREAILSYSELLGVGDLSILSNGISRRELGETVSGEIREEKERKAEEEKKDT
jgi:hypothetical protein